MRCLAVVLIAVWSAIIAAMFVQFARTMRGDVDSIADDHDTIFQRMLDEED